MEFFKTFIRIQPGFTGLTVLTDGYYFLFVNNYQQRPKNTFVVEHRTSVVLERHTRSVKC